MVSGTEMTVSTVSLGGGDSGDSGLSFGDTVCDIHYITYMLFRKGLVYVYEEGGRWPVTPVTPSYLSVTCFGDTV